MLKTLRRVAVGALLGAIWFSNAPAWAQPTVEPQSLSVSLPQYETVTRTVTVTNTGSNGLTFCVTFDRSLQRDGLTLRLNEELSGTACGEYGEVLYRLDDEDVDESGWGPSYITMTPDGRVFTHQSGGLNRTFRSSLRRVSNSFGSSSIPT